MTFPGCWFLVAAFIACMLHFMVIAWTPNITRPPGAGHTPVVAPASRPTELPGTCSVCEAARSSVPPPMPAAAGNDCEALEDLVGEAAAMRSTELYSAPPLLMLQNMLLSLDRQGCSEPLVRRGLKSLLATAFLQPPDSVQLVAAALQKMTLSYPLANYIIQDDCVKHVLAVLRSNVSEARYSGLWAATNLATYPEGARELMQEERLQLLLSFIATPGVPSEDDGRTQGGATWVLHNLAQHAQHRPALAAAGALERLIALGVPTLAPSEDPSTDKTGPFLAGAPAAPPQVPSSVQCAALWTLEVLAADPAAAAAITEHNLSMQALTAPSSTETLHAAMAMLLAASTAHPPSQHRLVEHGWLERCLELLHQYLAATHHRQALEHAMWALRDMSRNSTLLQRMLADEVAVELPWKCKRLGRSIESTQAQVAADRARMSQLAGQRDPGGSTNDDRAALRQLCDSTLDCRAAARRRKAGRAGGGGGCRCMPAVLAAPLAIISCAVKNGDPGLVALALGLLANLLEKGGPAVAQVVMEVDRGVESVAEALGGELLAEQQGSLDCLAILSSSKPEYNRNLSRPELVLPLARILAQGMSEDAMVSSARMLADIARPPLFASPNGPLSLTSPATDHLLKILRHGSLLPLCHAAALVIGRLVEYEDAELGDSLATSLLDAVLEPNNVCAERAAWLLQLVIAEGVASSRELVERHNAVRAASRLLFDSNEALQMTGLRLLFQLTQCQECDVIAHDGKKWDRIAFDGPREGGRMSTCRQCPPTVNEEVMVVISRRLPGASLDDQLVLLTLAQALAHMDAKYAQRMLAAGGLVTVTEILMAPGNADVAEAAAWLAWTLLCRSANKGEPVQGAAGMVAGLLHVGMWGAGPGDEPLAVRDGLCLAMASLPEGEAEDALRVLRAALLLPRLRQHVLTALMCLVDARQPPDVPQELRETAVALLEQLKEEDDLDDLMPEWEVLMCLVLLQRLSGDKGAVRAVLERGGAATVTKLLASAPSELVLEHAVLLLEAWAVGGNAVRHISARNVTQALTQHAVRPGGVLEETAIALLARIARHGWKPEATLREMCADSGVSERHDLLFCLWTAGAIDELWAEMDLWCCPKGGGHPSLQAPACTPSPPAWHMLGSLVLVEGPPPLP